MLPLQSMRLFRSRKKKKLRMMRQGTFKLSSIHPSHPVTLIRMALILIRRGSMLLAGRRVLRFLHCFLGACSWRRP